VVESCFGYEIGHRGRCDQLIAVDVKTGRARWRSAPLTAHDGFAIAGDVIVSFSPGTHGTSKSKRRAARIVALDRHTGATLGELPALDVEHIEPLDAHRVRVTTGPFFTGPFASHTLTLTREGARVRMTLH
jgi:outer membrane protein assembly factor BamB